MAEYPTDPEVVAELRRLAAHPSTIPQIVPEFFTLVADRFAAAKAEPWDEGVASVTAAFGDHNLPWPENPYRATPEPASHDTGRSPK